MKKKSIVFLILLIISLILLVLSLFVKTDSIKEYSLGRKSEFNTGASHPGDFIEVNVPAELPVKQLKGIRLLISTYQKTLTGGTVKTELVSTDSGEVLTVHEQSLYGVNDNDNITFIIDPYDGDCGRCTIRLTLTDQTEPVTLWGDPGFVGQFRYNNRIYDGGILGSILYSVKETHFTFELVLLTMILAAGLILSFSGAQAAVGTEGSAEKRSSVEKNPLNNQNNPGAAIKHEE